MEGNNQSITETHIYRSTAFWPELDLVSWDFTGMIDMISALDVPTALEMF